MELPLEIAERVLLQLPARSFLASAHVNRQWAYLYRHNVVVLPEFAGHPLQYMLTKAWRNRPSVLCLPNPSVALAISHKRSLADFCVRKDCPGPDLCRLCHLVTDIGKFDPNSARVFTYKEQSWYAFPYQKLSLPTVTGDLWYKLNIFRRDMKKGQRALVLLDGVHAKCHLPGLNAYPQLTGEHLQRALQDDQNVLLCFGKEFPYELLVRCSYLYFYAQHVPGKKFFTWWGTVIANITQKLLDDPSIVLAQRVRDTLQALQNLYIDGQTRELEQTLISILSSCGKLWPCGTLCYY